MIALTACTHVFETSADVQARQALLGLMEVQEAFHRENQRYATNLVEAGEYHLKYHRGIVYLEIQAADENGYRAISLAAESTTARVFAFDTGKGGFYEMDAEVPQYVQGALNQIRKGQKDKKITDLFFVLLVGFLLALGVNSLRRDGAKKFRMVYLSFFISLFPLGWSLAIINHMDKKIFFGSLIQWGVISSLVFSGFCLVACGIGISTYLKEKGPTSLIGLFFSTAVTSTFSIAVMVHTLVRF